MNELNIFENPEFGSIRTTMIDEEPWFVGKDVASALGYAEPQKAVRMHVDDEDKGVSKMDSPGGTQQMTIINESGLYCLILSSKLPSAKKFKRWVTSEVLPIIRKTGRYNIPNNERGLTKDDYLRAAHIVAGCRNERLPYVLNFLENAGFSVPVINSTQAITNYSVADDSVVGFLECFDDIEVENISTSVVYNQYRNYCIQNDLTALCKGEFSKQLKRILGVSIISKKIQGKTYRIFIKN